MSGDAVAGCRGAAAGRRSAVLLLQALAVVVVGPAVAQTDFYNLDKDRPLRVEDAYATKRYALEVQASPFTLVQFRDGPLRYAPSAEVKYGLIAGFEISAGATAALDRAAGQGEAGRRTPLDEVELSALLNLTVETARVPALGVRVSGHLPVGGNGEAETLEVKALATRSLAGPVRAHLNGAWVFGAPERERWWAGIALDYVLPFRHTLLLAETYVSWRDEGRDRVHSTAGFRRQLTPALALDAGAGRSWTGQPRRDWVVTVGLTRELGVRALMPVAAARAGAR